MGGSGALVGKLFLNSYFFVSTLLHFVFGKLDHTYSTTLLCLCSSSLPQSMFCNLLISGAVPRLPRLSHHVLHTRHVVTFLILFRQHDLTTQYSLDARTALVNTLLYFSFILL